MDLNKYITILNSGTDVPDDVRAAEDYSAIDTDPLFNKLWREIEEEFKWDKVHSVMKFLGWTWHFEQDSPSLIRLMRAGKERCWAAYTTANRMKVMCTTFTGGLKGTYVPEEELLALEFVVEHWDAYDSENE